MFLFSYFSRRKARARHEKESDYGRRYGWFVEQQGERIGELEYVRWDSDSQFWHEYRVTWSKKEAASIEKNPDAWIESALSLRNRKFQEVVVSTFLTAPRDGNLIVVRNACVPSEQFAVHEEG